MADAIKGRPFTFRVEGFNEAGEAVPLMDQVVVLTDNGAGGCSNDGSNGAVTPSAVGSMTLTATCGAFTASLTKDVVSDPTAPVGIRFVEA